MIMIMACQHGHDDGDGGLIDKGATKSWFHSRPRAIESSNQETWSHECWYQPLSNSTVAASSGH